MARISGSRYPLRPLGRRRWAGPGRALRRFRDPDPKGERHVTALSQTKQQSQEKALDRVPCADADEERAEDDEPQAPAWTIAQRGGQVGLQYKLYSEWPGLLVKPGLLFVCATESVAFVRKAGLRPRHPATPASSKSVTSLEPRDSAALVARVPVPCALHDVHGGARSYEGSRVSGASVAV